jgi:Ca-activated chloride channel family protein
MQGQPLENAKKGAATFIDKMNKRDELEVITFNHRLTQLVPLDRVSVTGEKAKQRIQNLFADGGTRLFDGIQTGLATIRKRQQVAPKRRYGLVVLSDGDDTNSQIGRYDFTDNLPKGDNPNVIKIFTIAYGSQANKDLLIEVSKGTNARMFKSSPEDIEKVYRELGANF